MSTAISPDIDRTVRANLNRAANAEALRSIGLAVPDQIDGQWIAARDGSTTSRSIDGHWWAACSVPLLAGRALLEPLDANNQSTLCLLHPEHAGIIRAAREKSGPTTVMIVVHPDPAVVDHLLHEHDFSADIAAHRTCFFHGDQWAEKLGNFFDLHRGLATPSRFVRTRLTDDETINNLIAAAQKVFAEMAVKRTALLEQMRSKESTIVPGRVLVIGASSFHLWRSTVSDLAADLPAAGLSPILFDTEDALNGAPLALAAAADGCDAVFAADVFRAEARPFVSERTAWITHVTRPIIPAFETAGPRDRLLLADPDWSAPAQKQGWPTDRIGVLPHALPMVAPAAATSRLGLVADLLPVEMPDPVKNFSSHKVLWDAIENELLENPLVLGLDISGYLENRAGQLNLDSAELDRTAFCDKLIIPAYQRGLATLLVRSGLPVSLFGSGWIDDPALADFVAADLGSADDLRSAVARCSALVHMIPIAGVHPIDALGRPVVRPIPDEPFLRTARRAMSATTPKISNPIGTGLAVARAIGFGS